MGTLITKTCANCGRKFITRDRNKVYCDIKCEEYARDGLHVDYLPKEEKPVPIKICQWCGNSFTQKANESEYIFKMKKCCCGSCGQKLRAFKEKKIKEGRL